MPRGGVLSVSTHFDPERSLVTIEISDTGVGIPEEDLERIFEPFFTTKAETKGVGLGLSVAYGIIRQHHGEIRVQSEVGRALSFALQLPGAPQWFHGGCLQRQFRLDTAGCRLR